MDKVIEAMSWLDTAEITDLTVYLLVQLERQPDGREILEAVRGAIDDKLATGVWYAA